MFCDFWQDLQLGIQRVRLVELVIIWLISGYLKCGIQFDANIILLFFDRSL